MMTKATSIQRAITLLNNFGQEEDFVILKLQPESRSCCCFHCWPVTWSEVNRYLLPQGPIEDESDVLVVHNGDEFVLECHESGPEIVVYLGLATASILLVKSIVDLLTTFIKALQKEHRKAPSQVKLTCRRLRKGKVEEELLAELDFPLSTDITEMLNSQVRKSLQRNTENGATDDVSKPRS